MIKDSEMLTGVVLSGAHGIYDVHTPDGVLRCTLRGKLRRAFAQAARAEARSHLKPHKPFDTTRRSDKQEQPSPPQPTRISVGDHVKVRRIDEHSGAIEEILPRQSSLSRLDVGSTSRSAREHTLLANLDQVVLVFATAQPEPHFGQLDRFLAICESAELHPLICLNKADLPHGPDVETAANLYDEIGYTMLWTSAQSGQGIEELRERLKGHTTLFTGPSGVGKSSLVNAIEPGMALRTGMVSEATGKGRHTTTGSQLFPLSAGGWLADSAGIRALAAWNIPPEELDTCFIEFRPYLGECEYNDCRHIDEEGCAIRQAVATGQISEQRYKSYVRMFRNEER